MSERSDASAARLRAAILRGDHADGERINQSRASRVLSELTDSPIPMRASPVWWREHAARERERLAALAAIKSKQEAMP